MANSTLQQDSKGLLSTLNDLLKISQEHGNCIFHKTFDCKDGYLIYHVLPDFTHHLKDIVNSGQKSFFLVSKLPLTSKNYHNNSSYEEMTENIDQQMDLNLPVISHQHVFVGTPIGQKVYHLFRARDLHSCEVERDEKLLDLSGLEKLDVKYARYFLSLYVQCLRCQPDLPEVWLVCDQNNHQGITHLGITPGEVLESEKKRQKINTVLVKSQHFDGGKKESFTLGDQKKRHMVFNRASYAEIHGYARYNIYGGLECFRKDASQPESSITMEFAWDDVREILQPPPPSSNAVLNICAHPEDVRNILSDIANELNLLINHFSVVQILVNTDQAEEETEEEQEEFNHGELEKEVLSFLDDLKSNSFTTAEQKAESVSESPTSNLTAPFGVGENLKRQDLDNTERLWLFLKDFTSSKKIVFCLKVIFSLLFDGEYQPVLSAANQTQIAKLIKEIICCQTDHERANVKAEIARNFSTGVALQCVIEVGLEKLRNDYTNYFIKQELVTMDKLDYYLAKDVPLAEKFQRLLKLHCVLALVTLSISYAHITFDDLRALVAAAMKYYKTHCHTEHPVFSLSLPAFSSSSSNVKNVCIRQFQPQTWMVALTTMNEHNHYSDGCK